MTTRLELRTALRQRLEDTSAGPLWDDAALNEALADAVRRYGMTFPREARTTVSIDAGATSAVVSPEIPGHRVVRVIDERGVLVPREAASGGDAGTAQAWRWWGSALHLARGAAASGEWTIEYLADRDLPEDDAETVGIVPGDEPIVVLLALGTALRRRAVEDGKRGHGRGGIDRAVAMADAEITRLLGRRRRRARSGWIGA